MPPAISGASRGGIYLKERKLAGMHRPRWDAAVSPRIDPVEQGGMPLPEHYKCLRPGASEPCLFPDLVEPARIAIVALGEIALTNAQPARDPDIDGVSFGQWTRSNRDTEAFGTKLPGFGAGRTNGITLRRHDNSPNSNIAQYEMPDSFA